jgi:hypothetical protein
MNRDTSQPPAGIPDTMTPGKPNWRMPVGVVAMMVWIIAWTMLASEGIGRLEPLPQWARALLYCVAGIVWILPLRPLMVWMNRATKG